MYAVAISPCFGCKKIFAYNPLEVPSIRVNGIREPVCQSCVDEANPIRIANGLQPITPSPDAYGSCTEAELDFVDTWGDPQA